ncbi:BclA C-terminal domain-containing protein, partial [Paenibacillus glucanolyticus]
MQGQVVTYNGSTYLANVTSPQGVPGMSPDYTLLAAAGAGLNGVIPFDPAQGQSYPLDQVVTYNGSTYLVNVANPTGIPGASADYTLLAAAGMSGEVGITGATGPT